LFACFVGSETRLGLKIFEKSGLGKTSAEPKEPFFSAKRGRYFYLEDRAQKIASNFPSKTNINKEKEQVDHAGSKNGKFFNLYFSAFETWQHIGNIQPRHEAYHNRQQTLCNHNFLHNFYSLTVGTELSYRQHTWLGSDRDQAGGPTIRLLRLALLATAG